MIFTPEEIKIAVKVLSRSKHVENWAKGELRAFGLDINSPQGKKFFNDKRMEYARRLIK
jgi:hypothetical protein